MGEIVYDDDSMIPWAIERIGFKPRDDVRAIGWRENGALRAVTLYDGFSECERWNGQLVTPCIPCDVLHAPIRTVGITARHRSCSR